MPGPEDDVVRDIVQGIIEDDDAEERALSLALALQNRANIVSLTIDDSDEDDDGSSTASSENATQQTTQQTTQTQTQSQAHSQPSSSQQQQSQFGSVSLDRRAMEQERLNRLAKRQRPATDNDDDDDVIEVPPPKKQATRAPAASNIKTFGASASASANRTGQSSGSNSSNSSVPYPNPTVKRTWARGTARRGDEITIEDVFQKDKLELAVLSSFQWDEEWMLSKLDYKRTKIMLLAFARDEAQVLKFVHVSPLVSPTTLPHQPSSSSV